MVGPWPPAQGGVATFIRNVTQSSLRERYEFIRFSTARPAKRNVQGGDNYGYRGLLRGGLRRVLAGMSITLWHVAKFPWVVLIRRPALVQIQATDFFDFWEPAIYVVVARLLGKPVILRIGGSFNRFWETSPRLTRAAIAWTLEQPEVLIVQSDYWKRYMAGIRRRGPITVLNNFVPDTLAEQRAHAPPGVPRLTLYVGTMPQLKGALVLLAALRELNARGIATDVTFIGVTPQFRAHVAATGLPGITLRDFLSHAEMLAQLRRTDIFLQISYHEGFPNTLLEAMALGCTAIVTPVGAVPEVVGADGDCAFVIPVGDARALADRIARFTAEAQLTTRMAAACHRRILERFTATIMTRVLDKLYAHHAAAIQGK